MEYQFKGKRVIVTGAGKGIGRDISLTLAKQKASVIAISRTQSDLDSLKQEDSSIETYQADISDWDVIEKLLIDIGPVDGLVNNAAVLIVKPVLDFTKQDVDSVHVEPISVGLRYAWMITPSKMVKRLFKRANIIDINFKASFHVSQTNGIKHNKPGVIVNISSIAAKRVVNQFTVYSCAKAAMDRMTKNMAHELGPNNIRVNSVNPSLVKTNMVANTVGNDPELIAKYLTAVALGRFIEKKDVTNAVMYLLSDKAAIVSGITMVIDGGHITTFL